MKHIRRMFAALALALPAVAMAASSIAVHRDPGCGCCGKWAIAVRQQFGRAVRIVDDANRAALQRQLGVPADLSSCHTAIVDGLVFEGHVPVADMKRLLEARPKGVKGLAVAGMPVNSLGMEVPGARSQPYKVMAFGPGGRRLFASHGS